MKKRVRIEIEKKELKELRKNRLNSVINGEDGVSKNYLKKSLNFTIVL